MSIVTITEVGQHKLDRVNTILSGIPGATYQAVGKAMKRAAQAGKTEAGRYAAAVYNISKGTFMANTSISYEISGGGGAVSSVTIRYAGALLDLLIFKPDLSAGGVKYQAKRGRTVHLRHAFDIAAYGGHIYERLGRPRFPIRRDKGPSTAHMVGDMDVAAPLGAKIESEFSKRLEHEINRILNG